MHAVMCYHHRITNTVSALVHIGYEYHTCFDLTLDSASTDPLFDLKKNKTLYTQYTQSTND